MFHSILLISYCRINPNETSIFWFHSKRIEADTKVIRLQKRKINWDGDGRTRCGRQVSQQVPRPSPLRRKLLYLSRLYFIERKKKKIFIYLNWETLVCVVQFKSFSQQIDDIEINVFRSLDKVKAEPSEGSSFFRDCLIEWRVRFHYNIFVVVVVIIIIIIIIFLYKLLFPFF